MPFTEEDMDACLRVLKAVTAPAPSPLAGDSEGTGEGGAEAAEGNTGGASSSTSSSSSSVSTVPLFLESGGCRELRRVLAPIAEAMQARKFGGDTPLAYMAKQQHRRQVEGEQARRKELDQRYINR
jgi:hypothetical protein